MKIGTGDMISISEAKDQLPKVVSEVENDARQFLVMRHNRPAAAVVNVHT